MNQDLIRRKLAVRFSTRLIAAVLFLSASILFFRVSVRSEHLPVKTYTVADGLLRDSVSRIKQDSRGFLWFCTVEGISRFDGYAFTNFTTNDGLPDRHVNDFLETKNGTIYFATDAGLVKLNPSGLSGSKDNSLFTVILPDDSKAKAFKVLFEDENGIVWAGTDNGLYELNQQGELKTVDSVKPLTGDAQIYINAIIKDRHGAMWIGTSYNGLFRLLPSGEVEQFTQANGLPDINISSLLEDKHGRIWVGLRPHFDSGLILLVAEPHKDQNIVEHVYHEKDGLPSGWITDLYEDDEKFWVGTTRGLCLWQGENSGSVCKNYTEKNDLCDTDVWCITKDKDGNLWIGSRCGVKKWARYGFTSYQEVDGIGYSLINSVFENTAGEIFVSTNNGYIRTVSRFDGDKFEFVKPYFPAGVNYFGWGWKQSVWQDSVGDWWFPAGSGTYRFAKPDHFQDLAHGNPQRIMIGSFAPDAFRLFEDSHGDIWLGGNGLPKNTLYRFERETNTWHDHTAEIGLTATQFFSAFVEDKSGNLWIGTGSDVGDAGLIRYRDGQFKVFGKAEGAPPGWTRDLFIDHAGNLWLANTSWSLLRLEDPNSERLSFVRYTAADGLSSNGVYCITEDEYGRIYAGTGRGLDRLNPVTGQIENFTTADGLPNSDIEVAHRDKQNNLWFGTSGGLARYAPEKEKIRQPPNALITGLRVNGESQSVSILGDGIIPQLDLTSDQKQISVDFLGLGASLGEKLKYEYRLGESEWTPTTERTVNFANLNSGEYRFEARAVTADRIYSKSATVAFQIAAPFWKRWWFIALMLVLALLAGYFFYRNRLLRLLEMERMRTRIAADLHDDIGANLTRISLLSEVARSKSVNGNDSMLSSIANIARESVASMNDIVWAISPDHDRMLDLTRRMRQHAEEIFAMRNIDLDFDAAADMDMKLSVGVRRDVLLIFKEAVNNAARHSGCTKVEIDFRSENLILTLKIRDNGKGFISENHVGDGQGLRSMMRRSNAVGGKLKIDSQNNEGTIVEFELPLPKARFESRI